MALNDKNYTQLFGSSNDARPVEKQGANSLTTLRAIGGASTDGQVVKLSAGEAQRFRIECAVDEILDQLKASGIEFDFDRDASKSRRTWSHDTDGRALRSDGGRPQGRSSDKAKSFQELSVI